MFEGVACLRIVMPSCDRMVDFVDPMSGCCPCAGKASNLRTGINRQRVYSSIYGIEVADDSSPNQMNRGSRVGECMKEEIVMTESGLAMTMRLA